MALLNLAIMVEANQDALSKKVQPYDFYVLQWGASQLFSAPSQVYVWQASTTVGTYWLPWLRDGANYAYTPMFATLLYPLAGVYPPTAKLIWECLSYAVLIVACLVTVKALPWRAAKLAVPVMIFAMPLPLLYTNQSLPASWGFPLVPGMLISPAFFADYFHGNANTMILALALISLAFAAHDPKASIRIGRANVPPYILSSFFLALDTFKATAPLLILPFWLILSRRSLLKALGFFLLFVAVLNGVVLFEPVLLSGYWSKLLVEQSIPTSNSPLLQLYEYVWYYTIPLVGTLLVLSRRRGKPASSLPANGGPINAGGPNSG